MLHLKWHGIPCTSEEWYFGFRAYGFPAAERSGSSSGLLSSQSIARSHLEPKCRTSAWETGPTLSSSPRRCSVVEDHTKSGAAELHSQLGNRGLSFLGMKPQLVARLLVDDLRKAYTNNVDSKTLEPRATELGGRETFSSALSGATGLWPREQSSLLFSMRSTVSTVQT